MSLQQPKRTLADWQKRDTSAPHDEQSAVTKSRHNWVLYAFLFLLPLQNVHTAYLPNLGGGLNFLNVGFGLSLLGAWRCGGTITRWSSVQNWIFCYVAYALFSLQLGYTNVSSQTEEHFNVLKDAMLAVMLVFVTQMSVTDWTTLRRIILVTLAPLPYILRVTWNEHMSVSTWHYKDALRIQGTFALLGANEFSSFCVTMATLLFALVIAGKWTRWWKMALVGGIVCMLLGIIWTYSRTAYIAGILGFLTAVFLWRGRWKMIVPVALAAVVLPAVLPTSVTERFESTTIEEGKRDESTEMRFEFWHLAWNNFTSHPIFGSGYHTFHHHEINPHNMDTHNFFMRELTEKGLVGIAITIGLLLSILRASWRCMVQAPRDSLAYALGLGMLAAWVALIVSNFFGDRFTYYPMIGYFWVYLGLALKGHELARVFTSAPRPEMHPPRRFAQPAVKRA